MQHNTYGELNYDSRGLCVGSVERDAAAEAVSIIIIIRHTHMLCGFRCITKQG